MSAKRKGRILADDLSTADEEGSAYGDGGDLEGDGGETPRNVFSREWERDRKFLDSLRCVRLVCSSRRVRVYSFASLWRAEVQL